MQESEKESEREREREREATTTQRERVRETDRVGFILSSLLTVKRRKKTNLNDVLYSLVANVQRQIKRNPTRRKLLEERRAI